MPPNPQEAECVGDIFSVNACGSDMPASRIELRKQIFYRLAIKLSLWYCYGDVDIIEPSAEVGLDAGASLRPLAVLSTKTAKNSELFRCCLVR
jgi:hypothetical protein